MVGDTGQTVTAELLAAGAAVPAEGSEGRKTSVARVRADACRGLAVRNRRQGDRFRPVGLAGRKTLQDYFVDRKVPRADRDAVPIVVDDADRIVWVAGHGIDADFRVTESTQPVLVLRLKVLGGLV